MFIIWLRHGNSMKRSKGRSHKGTKNRKGRL